MRMSVVAEGVELDADEAALIAMGCDLMQGFGFCKPVPPAEVEALLAGGLARPVSHPEPLQTETVVNLSTVNLENPEL